MKRKVASVCIRIIAYIMCCLLFDACLGKNENLQCARKTIYKELEINDWDWNKLCQIESEGQSQHQLNCTLWNVGYNPPEDGDDCSGLKFSPSIRSNISGVEIHPLVDPFPNFRIKFRSIEWHYMQYRIQLQEGNVQRLCHKLAFASRPGPSLQVSFACWVFNDRSVGKTVELLMDVGNSASDIQGHSHFLMKLPAKASSVDSSSESTKLGDWSVVVVVDISRKPCLYVYWPAVPEKYNVTEYRVQISSDKPQVVGQTFCPMGYCSLKMFAGYFPRNVTVSVSPVHDSCSDSHCKSTSPLIILDFSLPIIFVVLMVLALVVGLLFIVFIGYYFCCYPPWEPLKVLLLYDATTKEHTIVVHQLMQYLEEVCQVRCLEGSREIPHCKSQNPDKWLRQALGEADAVLYIASPKPDWDLRYSKYPGLVYRALELIDRHKKCHILNRPGRFLVAVPPYPSSIPKELVKAPYFHLPKDLSWLLWVMYNQQHCWLQSFLWLAKQYFRVCCCPGPISSYHKHGEKLDQKMMEVKSKMEEDEKFMNASLSDWTGWTIYKPQGDKTDKVSLPEYYREIFEELLSHMQTSISPQDDLMREQLWCVLEEMQNQMQTENLSPHEKLLVPQADCLFGSKDCTIHHTTDEEDCSLHASINSGYLLSIQQAYEHGEFYQTAERQNPAPHVTSNIHCLAYKGEQRSVAREESLV